jgi:hypothetical protein
MEIQELRATSNTTIGFLDPGMVNRKLISNDRNRDDVETYVANALIKQQHKTFVLLPYNFEYVFPCLLVFNISSPTLTM